MTLFMAAGKSMNVLEPKIIYIGVAFEELL